MIAPQILLQATACNGISKLDLVPIPASQIWPPFPTHFARAPEPLPQDCYVKRPSLLEASTELSSRLLNDAEVLINEARALKITPNSIGGTEKSQVKWRKGTVPLLRPLGSKRSNLTKYMAS